MPELYLGDIEPIISEHVIHWPSPCTSLTMHQGIIAGAIAGLAGTWAMSEAQRLWTRIAEGDAPHSAGGRHDARDWQERIEHQNSNELAAQAVGRFFLGRNLSQQELRFAAPLAHYLFGAGVAAIYGAYAEHRDGDRSGAGFGATVWLAADELAMPLLGLSDSTARRPLEMHLQSLAAHLVYGTVTEMARRSLRARLDNATPNAASPDLSAVGSTAQASARGRPGHPEEHVR